MHEYVSRLLGLGARIAAMVGAAVVVVGCASTGNYPVAPAKAATPDYNYIVGPGDTLNIIVWRNPDLSQVVPVRPDGQV